MPGENGDKTEAGVSGVIHVDDCIEAKVYSQGYVQKYSLIPGTVSVHRKRVSSMPIVLTAKFTSAKGTPGNLT